MKKHPSFKLLVFILIIVNLVLIAFYLQGKKLPIKNPQSINNTPPEITELEGNNLSFAELKKYFTTLAEKKGAEYAYRVLKVAHMPPNTDMHLMGHVVGDVLYKQQGIEGIKICTQDFRNACSHSIVVGLLLDKGESILPDIAKACKQAPGGSGAYTMCYHGLGHGVLAYTNYDLEKAVPLCQKTESGQGEGVQCIGGMIMEIISGGDHDKLTWGKMRPKFLKPSDPTYPCMASFMPENARTMCLTYLTPYLWEAVGANIGNPSDEDFAKSFAICSKLDSKYRDICAAGFGKEFIVLAHDRDVRSVDQSTESQLSKTYNWCQLAKVESEIKACLNSALGSLFWGGENDSAGAIRFCSIIPDSDHQTACFNELFGSVNFYMGNSPTKKSFCNNIPSSFKDQCQKQING